VLHEITLSRGLADAIAQALGEPRPPPAVQEMPQCKVMEARSSFGSFKVDGVGAD